MLCIWWNSEGIINHFELVPNNAVKAALNREQLVRVYATLAARYMALINQEHAFLQYYNAPPQLNFSLILYMLALILRHQTVTCSAPWPGPSILLKTSKMGVERFLPTNRLSGIILELSNWHKIR